MRDVAHAATSTRFAIDQPNAAADPISKHAAIGKCLLIHKEPTTRISKAMTK